MDKNKEFYMKAKKDALRKHSEGEPLTLDETAAAIWDPVNEKKPMTAMGILKIERTALAKMKEALKKFKIASFDDVSSSKFRNPGSLPNETVVNTCC